MYDCTRFFYANTQSIVHWTPTEINFLVIFPVFIKGIIAGVHTL